MGNMLLQISFYALICCQFLVHGKPAYDDPSGCGGKAADVIFLLDASSSIRPTEFKTQTKFINNVVEEFDIRDSGIRVGLITFSDYVQEVFDLKSHSDKMSLQTAVSYTRQLTGGTYTERALLHAREMMNNQGRSRVAKVIIVMTDGQSDYRSLTIEEAKLAKAAGITIFAIGIGHEVDKSELEDIATKPEYVFTVNSFDALQAIKSELASTTCDVQSDYPGSQPRYYDRRENRIIKKPGGKTKLDKACGGRPADIVFCLDASGSIWGPDFQRQLQFVRDISSVFTVMPNMTKIGVMTFATEPKDWFKLNAYDYADDVDRAISRISQTRGGTNTGAALSRLRTAFFSPDEMREGVVHMAIVITDGRSSNRSETARQAKLLRDAGIYVFAVGVGTRVDENELHLIASQPSKDYVVRVENYQALNRIKKELAYKTCQVTLPPTTPEPITGCGERRPADIVFSVPPDASAAQAADILEMIGKCADDLDMGDNAVRVGMVPKECVSLPGIELSGKIDTNSVIEEFEKGYAAAHTSKIIKYMRKKSFTEEQGARKEAQKFGIIILDSKSQNFRETALEATKAKKNGIELFVIGIGDDVSLEEMKTIASGPLEDHILLVDSYDELPQAVKKLVKTINDACIEYEPEIEIIGPTTDEDEDDFEGNYDSYDNYDINYLTSWDI